MYLRSMVHNGIDIRPSFELSLPVSERGQWHNDQERSSNAIFQYFIQEGYTLYGFP